MFRRRIYNKQCFLILLFLFLLFIEELYFGILRISWMDYYGQKVYIPITKERNNDKRLSIAVIVISDKRDRLYTEYSLAQKTLNCYCQYYDYKLFQIALDQEKDKIWDKKCPINDFMFKRHCIIIGLMNQYPQYEYFYFLDADMGVINPNHLLEEYINPKFDLVFYERIFNYEFMAGSYIAKNTKLAKKILQDWVDYEKKLPQSYHGTDNAAIHQIIIDNFYPSHKDKCRSIWTLSENWDGVWKYVACSRNIMNGSLIFDKIEIRPKYSNKTWVRDTFLTNSMWSQKDFILHGWKKSSLNDIHSFAGWFSPLVGDSEFDLSKCSTEYAYKNWGYKDTFIKTDEYIGKIIQKKINQVKTMYENDVKMLSS